MSPRARSDWRRSEWLVPALLIGLSLVPAIAGTARLAELSSDPVVTPANARFVETPLPVVLHILSAIPYAILGSMLFMPRFRRARWHRAAGKVLGMCGLVVALTGLWMAHFYDWPAGDGVALYVMRLVVGAGMTASIVLGVVAARRRDIEVHGAWMIRAYALGMGAGTQVVTHLPWFVLVGTPDEPVRAVLMGLGWAINLVVAELVIRRGRLRAGGARVLAAAS